MSCRGRLHEGFDEGIAGGGFGLNIVEALMRAEGERFGCGQPRLECQDLGMQFCNKSGRRRVRQKRLRVDRFRVAEGRGSYNAKRWLPWANGHSVSVFASGTWV